MASGRQSEKNGPDGLKCACLYNCKPEWLQDGRAKKNGRDGLKCAWRHNFKPEWLQDGRAKKNRTKRIALFLVIKD